MEEFLKNWYGILAFVAFDVIALAVIICITYRWAFKRIFDAFISTICIVVLSPLYAVIVTRALLAKKRGELKSVLKGENFVGKKGKVVKLLSFESESADGEIACKYGEWIVKTKLYKLAELFNVFLGRLSFVGCKALKESDCAFLTDEEDDRHIANIGLINPLVISKAEEVDYEEMLVSDIKYAEKFSFGLDCKIFFTWLLKTVRGEGEGYLGSVKTTSYADELLKDNRITQADYDEAKKQDEAQKEE